MKFKVGDIMYYVFAIIGFLAILKLIFTGSM